MIKTLTEKLGDFTVTMKINGSKELKKKCRMIMYQKIAEHYLKDRIATHEKIINNLITHDPQTKKPHVRCNPRPIRPHPKEIPQRPERA